MIGEYYFDLKTFFVLVHQCLKWLLAFQCSSKTCRCSLVNEHSSLSVQVIWTDWLYEASCTGTHRYCNIHSTHSPTCFIFYPSLPPSISPCVPPSMCPSVYASIHSSILPSISTFVTPSIPLFIDLFTHSFVHSFILSFFHLPINHPSIDFVHSLID